MKPKITPHTRLHPLAISSIAIAGVLFAYLWGIPFLDRIELDLVDLRFRVRGNIAPGPEIVLATIDEKSLEKEGKWVWPRAKIAALVDRLTAAGAKVITFDIGFLERDTVSVMVSESLEKLGLPPEEAVLVRQNLDYDRMLAGAMQRAGEAGVRVVLGYFFLTDAPRAIPAEETAQLEKRISGSAYSIKQFTPGTEESPYLIRALKPQANIGIIADAAPYAGHFNMIPDPDGVVRSIPLVIHFGQNLYAPLSLQTVSAYLDAPVSVQINAYGITSVKVKGVRIPVNEIGQMFINYRGEEKTFPHIPVTDILRGETAPETLRDKIVLVGATAHGIYDLRVTPFSNVYPGLEIHANAIDNILGREFIQIPDGAVFFTIAAILTAGLLLGLTLPRVDVLYGTLITGGLAVGYILLNQYLFTAHGWIFNLIYPLLVMAISYVGITIFRYLLENRQKRFIKDAFSFYLAPSVIEELIRSPEKLVLGGEKRVITAFFSDVQGFTSISETLAPEVLVELLNEFLTEMTDIILKYEGTVDKFEGDAIIAFFGAPAEAENHALSACRAAIEMQHRLVELRRIWHSQGRPELNMRIGMCTGEAVVGNMGSRNRMDYTMIGDTVNTAARLEGLNKFYGTCSLVSETTRDMVSGDVFLREIDRISAVGKQRPVTVYEIIDQPDTVGETMRKTVEAYGKGLAAYRERAWDQAIGHFKTALALTPEDGPSRTLLDRCGEYRKNPPSPGWNRVFLPDRK